MTTGLYGPFQPGRYKLEKTFIMDKKTAKENLIKLVDYCVNKGGVFNNAASVTAILQSVEVLAADLVTDLKLVNDESK